MNIHPPPHPSPIKALATVLLFCPRASTRVFIAEKVDYGVHFQIINMIFTPIFCLDLLEWKD